MKKITLENLMLEYSVAFDTVKMTQEKLKQSILSLNETQVLEEEKGYLLFSYKTRKMALFCDEDMNRMRVISPITSYSVLAPKIKDSLMGANFHTALDARYGVYEDTLYAVFLHPLFSLQKDDFEAALVQLSNLVLNFSKTYSSAQIKFTSTK